MSEEIVNRVAKSPLVTIDLEELYPEGERTVFDVSGWLYEGLILREKDFRESVDNHNWNVYQDHFVTLTCKNRSNYTLMGPTYSLRPNWRILLKKLL